MKNLNRLLLSVGVIAIGSESVEAHPFKTDVEAFYATKVHSTNHAVEVITFNCIDGMTGGDGSCTRQPSCNSACGQ